MNINKYSGTIIILLNLLVIVTQILTFGFIELIIIICFTGSIVYAYRYYIVDDSNDKLWQKHFAFLLLGTILEMLRSLIK